MNDAAAPEDKPRRSARARRREIAIILLLIALSPYALSATSWKRPQLGLVRGRLWGCPNQPNCACSEYRRTIAFVPPIEFEGEPVKAWEMMQTLIDRMPRSKVIDRRDGYLHIEVSSPIYRFVDDVELRLDRANRLIHVRSAARIGYSDLGVNRRRVETIRELFKKAAAH